MSRISYSIAPSSDPFNIFTINGTGHIQLGRYLDREHQRIHTIKIIATDGGSPARSATCSLLVKVTDINDNPPYIKRPSQALLQENDPPRIVTELIFGDEDDWAAGHGPPFHIAMDGEADPDIKNSFKINFNPGIVFCYIT